ncbi:MAG TPA: PDDEXK nuclease domain-containing protein [Polyangiaceae bacterium]|nr:PDDEXK nuclease domain-containing protein [Polyangiaceae bacterium]
MSAADKVCRIAALTAQPTTNTIVRRMVSLRVHRRDFRPWLFSGSAFVSSPDEPFDDEEFYVDLVFYNVILKCYLLIDLKLGKLTHQDVGARRPRAQSKPGS